jgi:transposase
MIPQGVQTYVALEPVDMRWSFDRLSGIALERIGYEARSEALFVFCGKRRDAMKVLFFDGTGMCIFYDPGKSPTGDKRLDKGRLRWPEASEANAQRIEIDDVHLEALLDGIALERQSAPKIH